MNTLLASEREATLSSALDFEALISPVTKAEFFHRHWAKSTLVVHREDPGYYGDLFTLADVDRCLLTAAGSKSTVLEVVAPPGSGRKTQTLAVTAINKDRLYDAYLSGDTIRLIGVEKFWPSVALLVEDIQEALSAKVGVNLFLTPPHSQGFEMHFDLVDVIVVQLAGAKKWHIWEPTFQKPTETTLLRLNLKHLTVKDESKLKLQEEVLLKAGDFFYMPRGFYHKAEAVDELSLHLTFSIHPLYWMDFFQRAFELAAFAEPGLRGELPPGYPTDPQVRTAMAETFATLLQRFAGKANFGATLQSLTDDWIGSRAYPPDGHFAALEQLPEIDASSWVERRKGLICQVEVSEIQASIRFGPNRVQGPAAIAPALEFIRDHPHFQVVDLKGSLSLDSKVVLVRRLIREGLLRPAR
jgi:JmjC domain